jgi:hypothetical protein
MTPESAIRNLICSYLRMKGVFCFVHDSVGIYDPVRKKFRANRNPYRVKGVSDILGVLRGGRMLAIEVKVPGKYPTPEQRAFINAVNVMGGLAFVARSLDDVISELEKGTRGVKAV